MSAQYAVVTLSELPPSVNNLYAHGRFGRFKTPRYKTWIESAGWEVKDQKPSQVEGPYAVTMRFGRKDKRRDLDNNIKATMDLLVSHRIVEDDSMCRKIIAEWVTDPGVHILVVSTKEPVS